MTRLLLAAISVTALAHDLTVTERQLDGAVVVTCAYAGTEAAAYAAVEVFAPGEAKSEFQNGRTDARGRFAFVPDRPGEWRFVVDDEIGHRIEKRILVGAVAADATPEARWPKLALGLLVIATATGLLYVLRSRAVRAPGAE